MIKSKAFFINGGVGRVLCSIPALENYQKESGDENFIIVIEGGLTFFEDHPTLSKHTYTHNHKGLFENYLIDKEVITPEPYRLNEYFNQKCSIAQGFDMIINNLDEPRELQDPTIKFTETERLSAMIKLNELKSNMGKDKLIVIQPFGRGTLENSGHIADSGSRSFEQKNIVSIIQALRQEYSIVLMTEIELPLPQDPNNPVATLHIEDIKEWSSIINEADYFLGCDSLGQHIAKAVGTPSTVVFGSTFPINVSYPNSEDVTIIDVGKDKRLYQPIRISDTNIHDKLNDGCMHLTEDDEKEVISSILVKLGRSNKIKKTQPQNDSCCSDGKCKE